LAQAAAPAREFLDGICSNFSTKGHAKAKGVSLSIVYPENWAAAEGERLNIVQKFVSEGGHGLASEEEQLERASRRLDELGWASQT
jgi:hypothetical protein